MPSHQDDSVSVVYKIISEELEIEPHKLIPSLSLIDDLHADSLALINIVMKVEEQFNIEVPDDEWRGLRTVGDIGEYVLRISTRTMEESK